MEANLLQISSGKLFQGEAGRSNQLRGVFYSNLKTFGEYKIETAAGSLLPTSNLYNSLALVYEFTELMESGERSPGTIVSHGIDPYISDFATIISFSLNCVASADYELTNRLISDQRGLLTSKPPKRLIKRFFDNEIFFQSHDKEYLINFVKQLIGLERKYFLGAMRAIRTYVTGMHRIADDVELAYTLLVASIESLAQDFDGYQSIWSDFDENKRKKIDEALVGVHGNIIEKVRSAILEIEHTSLAKRFQSFATNHLAPSFYRQEAENVINPIAKSDLHDALAQAYRARSRYIHNLHELPRILTLSDSFGETLRIEGKTWLTLQGLARLSRHVITEFIMRQSTVDRELYDYRYERAGTVQLPLAPQYWVGNITNFNRASGCKKLEGFLEQLGSHLMHIDEATITDLRPVLIEVEKLLPNMKKLERLPFLALYLLFNELLPEEDRMKGQKELREKYVNEITAPSSEAIVVNLLLDLIPDWELLVHDNLLTGYFKNRDNKFGFRAPRILEAGMVLMLAERYRLANKFERTQELISLAVETYPEHQKLREFETEYCPQVHCPIDWSSILIPDQNNAVKQNGTIQQTREKK